MKAPEIITTASPFTGEHGGATRLQFDYFTHLNDQGPPWFATIQIEYVPREKIMVAESAADYMDTFRDVEAEPEEVVKKICEELSAACEPMAMTVAAQYATRAGVQVNTQAKYMHPDTKQPQQRILHG